MYRPNEFLRQRINTLSWSLPLVLALVVLVYQLGLARWVHDNYGDAFHFGIEVLFFATTGPLITFLAIKRVGVWLDEKEIIQQEAEVQERQLASITSASADAIIGIDRRGMINSWNRGATLLFDYDSEDAIGESLGFILANPNGASDEFNWLIEAVEKNNYVRGYETVCTRSNGRPIDVELTATSIVDESSDLLGMSVILRDTTERKAREAEIRRLNTNLNQQVAERTQLLGEKVGELATANVELKQVDQHRTELVSLVSHQIRAPLTNVRGAIERMQSDCLRLNSTCMSMFVVLQQQVSRLDNLVQDVLNATRIEAGELVLHREPISPFPIVTEVAKQFQARSTDRSILVSEKPGLPLVFADPDCTTEVLANLLDNADKFSSPNGKIEIDLQADQSEVIIRIKDYGSGLEEKALDRVFEKFYRADSSDSQATYGYGLGLYICRLLTEAQGGRIWAENHPEGGAVFSLSLPVWREQIA